MMTIADLLSTNLPLFISLTFIFGLLVGSFINVVIYRLPLMMEHEWRSQCHELLDINTEPNEDKQTFNLAFPDSHCPKCNHKISMLENIPVVSYLVLAGKCSQCKESISLRYPIIEFICGLLSAFVAYTFGFTWLTLALLFFTWCLLVLTMIDFDQQILPDDITLPLLWLGLIVNSFGLLTSLENAVWGAIIGYGSLWAVFWLFKLITGKDGLGYGDFKLLGALGAWLGWQSLPLIIPLSSLVGAIVGLSLIIIKGRNKNIPIPFGPYLAGAGFISLIWGDQITNLYIQFFM